MVHVGGTGVMAFCPATFKINADDFPVANMADLWAAKAAHKQGLKITTLAHPYGYLVRTVFPNRIWLTAASQDEYQTKVINDFLS